jgi:hypothetical protein
VAEGEDEDGGDMQVAWECLEVARKIFEGFRDGSVEAMGQQQDGGVAPLPIDADRHLPEVYERLGDLQKFNGNYKDAIVEYGRCLGLRQAGCEAWDRRLSQAHFNLAVAHIYNSGEEGADVVAEKKAALKHYRAAREALLLAPGGDSHGSRAVAAEEDAKERVELAQELSETVIALTAEIQVSILSAMYSVDRLFSRKYDSFVFLNACISAASHEGDVQQRCGSLQLLRFSLFFRGRETHDHHRIRSHVRRRHQRRHPD